MAVVIKVNHGDRHQSSDPNRRRPAMSSSNTALITGASAGTGAVYADRLAPVAAMADFPSVTQSRFHILPGIAGRPVRRSPSPGKSCCTLAP
jgi:hypothetical protein